MANLMYLQTEWEDLDYAETDVTLGGAAIHGLAKRRGLLAEK